MKKVINGIYGYLLNAYGPQGWWPLTELHACNGINPTKTGSLRGYHPGDYSYPKNENQQFEISCGALLTQNTSWPQVEKALLNLQDLNALSPEAIISIEMKVLKKAIKPAGYFNQKALRLKVLADWFSDLPKKNFRENNSRDNHFRENNSKEGFPSPDAVPTREELLSLNGVGPETADSILLYAFKQPSFVVDTYTRRILENLGFINEKTKYEEIKALFEENLPLNVPMYQEYHALLVEHAKRHYQKKDMYWKCPLLEFVQSLAGKSKK